MIENPGNLRVDKEQAMRGGKSDPRNVTIMKMFNLLNIGERAGSGVPSIYHVWHTLNMGNPLLTEEFNPERVILTLPLETARQTTRSGNGTTQSGNGTTQSAENTAQLVGESSGLYGNIRGVESLSICEKEIVRLIRSNNRVSQKEISDTLHINMNQAKYYLKKIKNLGIISREGNNRTGYWRLHQ